MAFGKPLSHRNNIIGRKDFLLRTGILLGGSALWSAGVKPALAETSVNSLSSGTWEEIRNEFNLDPEIIQMAHFYLTSHPKPVREAINKLRDSLDKNPIAYIHEHRKEHELRVLKAASEYLGVNPDDIALTDSTTMGLGLLYSGLELKPDQEILTTTHDHYSTEISLQLRADRTGAKIKRISLYEFGKPVTSDEIVQRFIKGITPKTRYAIVTWVHSCSGMKLPIARMSAVLKEINKNRDEKDKVIFCVDGVHGLGVEDTTIPELGCDFFIAGTHKWIFGPRGTGIVWGKPEAWKYANATIPTFTGEAYEIWMGIREPKELSYHVQMTPGGFHSFEHRWALDKAFEMHQSIGKSRIASRIHELNKYTRDSLKNMKKVKLITPDSEELSSGITCFEVEGKDPYDFVDRLWENKIAASVTPYRNWFVRLAPGLVTLEEDVEKTINIVRKLAV